ncbi:hypothetical protein OPV22_006824 [Ensete ventricosum]|uniref:Uncharacterized protein n=1 Tax=Ensete ventricosum TaxID=4639 RepID=A0AAV8RJR8_ENSVE|nr:hypothetical protein OPV22_006824 [Ensete ventricosum]
MGGWSGPKDMRFGCCHQNTPPNQHGFLDEHEPFSSASVAADTRPSYLCTLIAGFLGELHDVNNAVLRLPALLLWRDAVKDILVRSHGALLWLVVAPQMCLMNYFRG